MALRLIEESGRMRMFGNASQHGRCDDAVSWSDRQHVQATQKVFNVNNSCERDLDGFATRHEASVDAENNIQMFVPIAK